MPVTTERLYEFVVLSQTLNFKKAAQQLFLTQSILSRHIMEMEKEFGLKLFIRDTRSVALTEAGKRLAEDMKRIINECDLAVSQLRANSKVSGTLTVGCTDSCVCMPYIMFLRRFAMEHPDIDLQLAVTQGPVPTGKWMQYDFFFSPCIYSNIPNQFKRFKTFRQAALLVYPKEHRFYGRDEISLAQLTGETLYVPWADEPFGPFAKNKQLAEKFTAGNINVVSSVNKPTALLYMEIGQGVTIMPPSLLRAEQEHLGRSLITDPDCNFDLYMYTNPARQEYAFRCFLEEILKEYADERKE